MGHWEQSLGDATYPELYQDKCPQHLFCEDYETDCLKTRKWTAEFTLVAEFPDDATDEQKAQIITCAAAAATIAAGLATGTYLTEAPIVGAALAVIKAANIAIEACRESFDFCIGGLPEDIKERTGIAVNHTLEQTVLNQIIYTVSPPGGLFLPDLVPQGRCEDGNSLIVTVYNQGKLKAGSSTLRLVFFPSITLFEMRIPSIPPSSAWQDRIQIPPGAAEPNIFFAVIADVYNEVFERFENNNIAYGRCSG